MVRYIGIILREFMSSSQRQACLVALPSPTTLQLLRMAFEITSNITQATFTKNLQKARTPFSAYAGSVNRNSSFQYFSKELAFLTGNYALPTRDILLARNPRVAVHFFPLRNEETLYLA